MTEKITMIELFSGIGAQERALRQIGVPYEITHTCDCDKDAVLSYASMRNDFENKLKSYSFPSTENMIAELQAKNVGYDFMKGKHTITTRTPIEKLKQYYLADKLSKNLGDISKVTSLPYADMVTYSFPCTDLSVAGKGEGMQNKCDACGHSWPIDFNNVEEVLICPNCGEKVSSSTRSGLLGQVQRLLSVAYENNTLPKYLLLENVKNLVGKKFKPQFDAWINWLDDIGYNTSWKILNSKHMGIPQNRERIFALSIRKDIDNGEFKFPDKIPLTIRLKDILEKNVDEKFYLPDERVGKILDNWTSKKSEPNIIKVAQLDSSFEQSGRVYDSNGIFPTIISNSHGKTSGGYTSPKIMVEDPFIVASRGRNPENPSDRTTGSPTEQRLEPNFSGTTNCLTSVQKDNYVCEPIIYDDYNSRISSDQDAINTLTTNCGASAERNGVKILMPVVVEPQLEFVGGLGNRDWAKDGKKLSRNYPQGSRVYSSEGVAAALTAQGVGGLGGYSGLYAIENDEKPDINPQLVGGIGEKNFGKQYRQGNRVYDSNAIAMALNAQPVGNAGGYSYLYAVEEENKKYGIKVKNQATEMVGFDEIAGTLLARDYKGFGNQEMNAVLESTSEPEIIKEDIVFPVMVRKYEVDIENLKVILREHKNCSNKDIAEKLNVPLTQVEHWFRQDEYFAIPDADIWPSLKDLLNITTNEFDLSITTFEVKDGVYDKSNRCYHINGIAPTLTVASGNEKIIEPVVNNVDVDLIQVGTIEGNGHEIRRRIYDENGVSPTLCGVGQGGNTEPKILTNNIRWRIRKLTPKECWRLMGFTDNDHDRAAKYVSVSSLYKQAGNSICTSCLIAIFNSLFKNDNSTSYKEKLVDYSKS